MSDYFIIIHIVFCTKIMCKRMIIEMPFMYKQDCKFYYNKDGVTFDNQPFRPSRIKKLDCQYGPHYFKPKDRTTDRPVIQTTRKKNCPVTITIREFEVFPNYGYSQGETQKMSDYALRKFKLSKLESLRSALASQQPIKTVILYHVSLPPKAAHTKHNFEMKSLMAQQVHPMVAQKIVQLVHEGATNAQEVKRALREDIKSEMKENYPDQLNRSYFPSIDDICNHIYLVKQGLEFSKFDQGNLNEKSNNGRPTIKICFIFFDHI